MADIKVEPTNPYPRPVNGPNRPPAKKKDKTDPVASDVPDAAPSSLAIPSQVAFLIQQSDINRERMVQLELQLREVEAERRADILRAADEKDKLMRELIELERRAAKLETELELWRSGRLKPE